MALIILPTRELVTQMLTYDNLFHFLPDGVKDVIKAAVVNQAFARRSHISSSKIPGATGLVGNILSQYDDWIAQNEDMLSALRGEYVENPLADYIESMARIEYLTMWIQDEVRFVLNDLMRSQLYDIQESHRTRWHQRDLLVELHLLGEPPATRRQGVDDE